MNLVNAIRVAASPEARGMGVLVVLNDEIHAAREVTKTSTLRLQTFRTPDFGVLGHADGDAVAFYRRPLRRAAPDTEFDIRGLEALPRVDIAYAYAGGDGTAVRAFVAAGARGIVSAGFAPGFSPPGDFAALQAAVGAGRGGGAVHAGRVRADLPQHAAARGGHPDRRQPQPAEGAHPAGAGADGDARAGGDRADLPDVLTGGPGLDGLAGGQVALTSGAAWRSRRLRGPVAQLVEHETFNLGVVGSSPTGPTKSGKAFRL